MKNKQQKENTYKIYNTEATANKKKNNLVEALSNKVPAIKNNKNTFHNNSTLSQMSNTELNNN